MPDVPELVALLYQADWTQFSLSATVRSRRDPAVDRELQALVSDERRQAIGPLPGPWRLPGLPPVRADEPEREHRVLLAPGGRYRVEADDGQPAAVGDGPSHWLILGAAAYRCPSGGPHRAGHGLFTPQWLIACYDLDITGVADIGSRSAYRVTATPRAVRSDVGQAHRLDRVEVLVDAGLGIILRSEQVFRGRTLAVAEIGDLSFDPPQAADPGQFAPPPGTPERDQPGFGTFEPQGPGWQAAITVADAAASAMGFAVRHAPRRPRPRTAGDDEPEMPPGALDLDAVMANLVPLGDDLVNLLHRTGLAAQDFGAELHQWLDAGAVAGAWQAFRSMLPQPLDGILGPDALWEAVSERGRAAGAAHRTARLQVSMPGRYRVDYLTGDWSAQGRAVACDGEHTSKLYANRVATGPAKPLEQEFATMVDPAWMLHKWTLTAGGEASVGGRRGLRIVAQADGGPLRLGSGQPFSPIESVVDAELGILLRQTCYTGGLATRTELRNVTAAARASGFRIDRAPGMRAVTDTGGLLADRDLPAPVKAAGAAAVLAATGAIAGAVAVTGWLQKRRARPEARRFNARA